MLKKFHWPSLYSRNPREKIFFSEIFQPMRFREKIKFDSSIFSWLESRDQWTVMLKKFYWPLLNSPNPREKFFFIKFFQLIRIREKIKFNSSIFLSLESRDQWTVMLKKFHWPSLYSQNPREKIFFSENFSTNEILRKNEIRFFDFFLIGIERSVNSDAEKILLTFVEFSKSAGKIFFSEIFSTNQNSGKNQIQFFDFFVIEIERSVNSDAEKILLTFVEFSKSAGKIFFYQIFSTNQNSGKN